MVSLADTRKVPSLEESSDIALHTVTRHPHDALSAAFVRNVKTPGLYADGNCLHLVVHTSGAKRWILRVTIHGKRRDMGLGGYALTTLAQAREKAILFRTAARAGDDPIATRRQEIAAKKKDHTMPTFEAAAIDAHGELKKSFKNAKHSAQWITTLQTYAFPTFGKIRVDRVSSADVMAALQEIWLTTPETARRVLQRVKAVFDWSVAKGYRKDANPCIGITKVLAKHNLKKKHFAALAYSRVPEFVAVVQEQPGISSRLAFEFLILTAARSGEVLPAQWAEIDLEARIWTVPASRMKTKESHQVPLSNRCMAILEEAKGINDGGPYVFPGARSQQHFSNMVFHAMLDNDAFSTFGKLTPHGMRSSFRDWCEEKTSFANSVIEAALSHTIKNKVEGAYLRTKQIEKRKELMELWAVYVAAAPAKILQMRA